MRARTLLTLTAIVSSILGAMAVYLALTVPNDLKADARMKEARKDLAAGKPDAAQDTLLTIVQQFPRTDAAAGATVALVRLAEQERRKLDSEITRLRNETTQQRRMLTDLQQTVEAMKNAPPKVIVQAPPPKPVPKKAAPIRRPRRRR